MGGIGGNYILLKTFLKRGAAANPQGCLRKVGVPAGLELSEEASKK